ncbi:hypothetical protein JB92DRAFT_2263716 [Gautieria morchelliformis]|nr:hypothetical protein JB92DRAFT_2263716 [Gautieria morchelliformis]
MPSALHCTAGRWNMAWGVIASFVLGPYTRLSTALFATANNGHDFRNRCADMDHVWTPIQSQSFSPAKLSILGCHWLSSWSNLKCWNVGGMLVLFIDFYEFNWTCWQGECKQATQR